jgi:hypothetical protein
MTRLKQIARKAAHAATLAFALWWLVATSAPLEPPRDCFEGLANPSRLQVVLGQAQPSAQTTNPSCGAIDGLMAGGTLTLDLSQGVRPSNGGGCYGYETEAFSGANGVTPIVSPQGGVESSLTSLSATFAVPEQASCRGSWWLQIFPATEPASGQLISPLDAGAEQPWIVERWMRIEQGQFCDGAFTENGMVGCADTFAVSSITEVPAP